MSTQEFWGFILILLASGVVFIFIAVDTSSQRKNNGQLVKLPSGALLILAVIGSVSSAIAFISFLPNPGLSHASPTEIVGLGAALSAGVVCIANILTLIGGQRRQETR